MEQTTSNTKERESLIERLFRAGAHYGFSKSRRHPTAAPYLFGLKQGTDIFDLEKTSALLADAAAYLAEIARSDKQVLFVGTKDEVKKAVEERAKRQNQPHAANRWIGGMLTNFPQIQKRVAHLADLRAQKESGELERKYTKKELVVIGREMEKLIFNFGGITGMDRLPGALVIVDPRHEATAVREANDMNIPVIAIMSSDCDARGITKPVYANDAHQKSVEFVLDELVAGYESGRN